MKTFKTIKFPVIIAFAIVSFFAFSCEKDDNEPIVITEDITFSGRMTVDQLDGTKLCCWSESKLKLNSTTSEGILTIEMLQKYHFAKMPVKLDMQITGK
jgi:hypothetical protein